MKNKNDTNTVKDVGKGNPYRLQGQRKISAATVEISMEISQKIKNRTIHHYYSWEYTKGMKVRI
jgi:hypothetical protein